ncbi:MAG: hypothetical protein DDT34_02324 [Firmicutes bacterium]|nr:hypothetical protein [Bacillota bacterium]
MLLLHCALIVIALAGILTGLFAYRGNVSLIEGQSFRDVRDGYLAFWPGMLALPFGEAEFTLRNVLPPEQGSFGFPAQVQLEVFDAKRNYAAEKVLPRNSFLVYRGLRLYPRRFGYAPLLSIGDERGEPFFSSYIGLERRETEEGIIHEDTFSLPGVELRLTARYYPPTEGQIPLLKVSLAGTTREEIAVVLEQGKGAWAGNYYLEFTDVRRYQRFHVVRDIGIYFFAIGSFLFLFGAGLYYLFPGRKVIIRLKQEGEELAISGIFRGLGQQLLESEFALFLAELTEGR